MKRNLLFLFVLIVVTFISRAQDFENGLVFYLPCDDSSTIDLINDAEGFINGDLKVDTGFNNRTDGSFYFNGTDAFLEFIDAEIEGLPVEANERSFAVWIKTTATGINMDIISYGTTSNGQHVHLAYRSGESVIRNGYWYADYDVPASISDGSWYHIVATLGSVSDIYINGELIEEQDLITSTELNTELNGLLRIGKRNTDESEYFEGNVDEVRIYDRVLSEDDVIALYEYDPDLVSVKDIRQDVFKVYPTIVGSRLNFSVPMNTSSIEIFNISGKLVKKCDPERTVSVSELPSGIYLVKCYSSIGNYCARFVKE